MTAHEIMVKDSTAERQVKPTIMLAMGENGSAHCGLAEHARQLVRRISTLGADRYEFRYHAEFPIEPGLIKHATPMESSVLRRVFGVGIPPVDLWHNLNHFCLYQPPRTARRSLVTIHDLNFLYGASRTNASRGQRRVQRVLGTHDRFVAISNFVYGDITKHFGTDTPGSVIHNGVTSLAGTVVEQPAGAPNEPFLFHLSRMSHGKNIDAVLRLCETWTRSPIVLAGPRRKDSIAALQFVRDRGLDHVSVLFDVSEAEKAWLYANCSAFVFPSRCEGFGLPPIEAMCFGKAAVLSRLTSLPEVGGKHALYVDEFDGETMAAACERAVAAGADAAYQQQVRDHAASFDWDRTARRYLEEYDALLAVEGRAAEGTRALASASS